jgi:hypothetical protein
MDTQGYHRAHVIGMDARFSPILPGLYLGDMTAALDKQTITGHKITHIVNASNGAAPNRWEFGGEGVQVVQYFNVDIEDNESTDIAVFLGPATRWIEKALGNTEHVVFVHCMVCLCQFLSNSA